MTTRRYHSAGGPTCPCDVCLANYPSNAAQEAFVANAMHHFEAYLATRRCTDCDELLRPEHDDPESSTCNLCVLEDLMHATDADEAITEHVAASLRRAGYEVC